ncbi:MAG: serine/threonine-protein phosphatase [Verrucomicrobia bacterium]|nr:serine/threonine-protein phosphatase [Verrucomicrobiota bacterium]
MKLRSSALTDIGKIRQENEDRFLREDDLGLYGVADGIGGLPGGAEAASCAAGFIKAGFKARVENLSALTQAASAAVTELGDQINPSFGIGTTLTFGRFRDGRLDLAHVGDSRCYVLRDGRLTPLTEDHNVENEARHLRAQGKHVEVSAANRNALTRCIGQPGLPAVDLSEFPLRPGDRLFFTTDGITRMVEDKELEKLLARDDAPEAILRTIVDLGLERGGYDNLTAVLVFVDEVP